MKTAELQKKTRDELAKLAREERVRLAQLRFELPSGKVKNVREIRQIRRNIARVETLLQQKQ